MWILQKRNMRNDTKLIKMWYGFIGIKGRTGLQERARCLEKFRVIGGVDSYELAYSSWISDDLESSIYYISWHRQLPGFHCAFHCVWPRPCTVEDFESNKSLEAYNEITCGWVRHVQYQVFNDRCVLEAKIRRPDKSHQCIMPLVLLPLSKPQPSVSIHWVVKDRL